MTRQDRESAIADNIEYLDRAVAAAVGDDGTEGARAIVFVGFSQGASMAARAAVRGRYRAAGLILVGGDIPQDVRDEAGGRWPPVLIGCGDADTWYSARVDSDAAFLESRGIPHEIVRFTGGHEFTDEFRVAAGRFVVARADAGTASHTC
jgi:predicted esterase